MNVRFCLVATALVLAGTAGCISRTRPAFVPGVEAGLTWPGVPMQARLTWAGEYGTRSRGYARPHGVGLAVDGSVCVADTGAGLVWLHPAEGVAKPIGAVELLSPVDCAFLPNGDIVVADSSAARLIVFDARGRVVWASSTGEFARPTGVAVDTDRERVVVCDAIRHELVFVDYRGETISRLGARGTGPGEFNFPTAVAIGPAGMLYVIDSLNFRIQVLASSGEPHLSFGLAGDGPGTFQRPRGLGVDRQGHVYVADAMFDNVQIFDSRGRLLMALGVRGRGPGEFWMPAGVAVDRNNRLFVSDAFNHRVQVFHILPQEMEVEK